MAGVIGVRFKNVGKVYYFDPDGSNLKKGDIVIVETSRGVERREVAMENHQIDDGSIVQPPKKLVRTANQEGLKKLAENQIREKSTFKICGKKIAVRKLKMRLMDMECTLGNDKTLLCPIADGRVDFRELTKDLASAFRTRIKLRQIGVRDEVKTLGGLGIYGRPFCCSIFLGSFQPVPIRMAEEQDLSLNPIKVSGTCGRLMCYLKCEQEACPDLLRATPKLNAIVMMPEGRGTVVDQNLLAGILQIRPDKAPDVASFTYRVRDMRFTGDAQPRVNKTELDQLKELEKD